MLLIDISNTFTKVAVAHGPRIGRPSHLPTPSLCAADIRKLRDRTGAQSAVVASVVPAATARMRSALPKRTIFVGHRFAGGLRLRYPRPDTIGADRIANAVACLALHPPPAVVVDFGTAVTFDVLDADGAYVGGVIAPGLNALAEYLHTRTALLPRITLRQPARVVGRSTREAMLSGAIHGYRGLVAEILLCIREEEFGGRVPFVVATGGDARLIARALPLFDRVEPGLTLRGLLLIGRNHL
jgi:type III pantothenate kinase